MYDVAVIGAGPAGLSAAIYAVRKNLSTICDGPLFKDLAISIVGGGNSGLEAAIEMDGIAKRVSLRASRV